MTGSASAEVRARGGTPRLILASQSPRRAQLLQMLGLQFTVTPADIDETFLPGEEPGAHAVRLACEKARKVATSAPDALVVGSDTVVVLDGIVLGKPRDDDDATAILLALQGRTHDVLTALAVVSARQTLSALERVQVRFREFDAQTARAYVATGEPHDKAGAYGIQGFGATLVEGIQGDFYAVMGFPVARFMTLLRAHGWCYDFRGLQPCERS
jgi:septum formation protein